MTTMRQEISETLDTLETWTSDDDIPDEFRAAFPDPVELSQIAHRLHDAANALAEFALAIWPKS